MTAFTSKDLFGPTRDPWDRVLKRNPSVFGDTTNLESTVGETCCLDDTTYITVKTDLPNPRSDTYGSDVAMIRNEGLLCRITYKRWLMCTCSKRRLKKQGFSPKEGVGSLEGYDSDNPTKFKFKMVYRRLICPALGVCPDACAGRFRFPPITEFEYSDVFGQPVSPAMCAAGNAQTPPLLHNCIIQTHSDAAFILDIRNHGHYGNDFPRQDLADMIGDGLKDKIKERLDRLKLVNFDCGRIGDPPIPH